MPLALRHIGRGKARLVETCRNVFDGGVEASTRDCAQSTLTQSRMRGESKRSEIDDVPVGHLACFI